MFNISDLIVLLLIALAGFLGYKRGFVKTSFRIISFILAIILSLVLYKPVGNIIRDNTNVEEWIISIITNEKDDVVEDFEKIEDSSEEINEAEAFEELEEEQNTAIQNLPSNVKEYLGIDEAVNHIKDEALMAIAIRVSDIIINIMSAIIVYVVSRIILAILCFVLDGIMQIPVLKQVNEILGLILGIVLGILRIYIILAIIMLLSSFIQMDAVIDYIKASLIVKFLFENNLLISLLF